MKSIITVLICIIITSLSGCTGLGDAPAPNSDSGGYDRAYAIDWTGLTHGVKATEDMIALYALISETERPVLTPADVESVTGISGSTERYEGIEAQKDLVDYEYGGGIRLTVAYFDYATHLGLYIEDEGVFRNASIAVPDISALDLNSTYEDYVRVIGAKGVLIGAVGSHDLTFMWVNSKGHKLEATFYTSSGRILSSYNYW